MYCNQLNVFYRSGMKTNNNCTLNSMLICVHLNLNVHNSTEKDQSRASINESTKETKNHNYPWMLKTVTLYTF